MLILRRVSNGNDCFWRSGRNHGYETPKQALETNSKARCGVLHPPLCGIVPNSLLTIGYFVQQMSVRCASEIWDSLRLTNFNTPIVTPWCPLGYLGYSFLKFESHNNCDQYFIDIQVSLPYTLYSRKQVFIKSKTGTSRWTASGSKRLYGFAFNCAISGNT
jgi:hypothetical protein